MNAQDMSTVLSAAAPDSRKAIVLGDPRESEEGSHRSQHSLPVSQKSLEMESSRRLSDASRNSSKSLSASCRNTDKSNPHNQVLLCFRF